MKKDLLRLTNDIISKGSRLGILHLNIEDEQHVGNHIQVDGKPLLNFGSYSYLSLESDERLKAGAIDAIQRYGIQYPSSRSYASAPLYAEMEYLMETIFQAPIVMANSTTLGHQAVVPVIMQEGDVVILDQQVHSSVQYAVMHTQHDGVKVKIVRHNNIEELERQIKELAPRHKKIWYACDGVYSMYGDCAPLRRLEELLDLYPQFHLYVDDAHGMSWAGHRGTGYALSQINLHRKMILATSLNKAYAAGGAVFVIPDEQTRDRIRNCGGPLIFAGQQQNSALGAGIACAKIHLSPEIYTLQQQLQDNIRYCHNLLENYGLPIVSHPETPIFFIGLGLPRVGYNLVKKMKQDGFLVNLSVFPAVPESCTGVRFSVNRHHTFSQLESLTETLALNFDKALQEEARGANDIRRAFRRVAEFKGFNRTGESADQPATPNYQLEEYTSIRQIMKAEWNMLMAPLGLTDWDYMNFLENTFKDNKDPENNWKFHYYIIRDEWQQPVLATYFTLALSKDDLVAPVAVSKKIEQERKDNPYYLCSLTYTMGSMLSTGKHLYIDRSRKDWKKIMMVLLDTVWSQHENYRSNVLLLRDFDGEDKELREFLLEQGFTAAEVPAEHSLNLNWKDHSDYRSRFNAKQRNYLKREIHEMEKHYEVKVLNSFTEKQAEEYYQLYKNVKQRSFETNSFDLPLKVLHQIASNPQWEVIELRIKTYGLETVEAPLAGVSFCYRTPESYTAVFLGMDYKYRDEYHVYKQILWQILSRANKLGYEKMTLGQTASANKRKLGAVVNSQTTFVQIKDKYNATVIASIVNQ